MEALSSNSLIKDVPISLATLDTDLRFINHSDLWLQEYGIKKKSVVGKLYYDVIPHTPNELKKIHQDCLKGNSNTTQGHKFIGPDGSTQWLKWKISPWKTDDGSTGGIIIITENITEQKRNEELLAKTHTVSSIGGWEVDLILNKMYWTAITREIHEVAEDYVPTLEASLNFYKLNEHRDKITMLISECIRDGKPWDTELQMVTATGREIWIRSKGEAEINNEHCVRLFGTLQDIDEQKKAELEYHEMVERLTLATNSTNVGIWEYNIVENNLHWDNTMLSLYGIRKENFTGTYKAWEERVHPGDIARCRKELEMALSDEKKFKTEFRVVWPNNEIHYIHAESIVQKDKTGKPLKMIGINWDITAIRKSENDLMVQLDITNDQNNSLLNFAHIVSHNLRSHSSNLSMLITFLLKKGKTSEKVSLMKMLKEASDSLNETVLHLNEVVQVKTMIIDQYDNINLYHTLKNVEKNIGSILKENNVKCTINVPRTINIHAVSEYLDNILLNLFNNSIKYRDPDRRPVITISSKKQGKRIILSFKDNGLGIDLDRYGKKLFGMYKTFHTHKNAKGMGLFITKNQMEAMKGKIEVESIVGVGTTFVLYFNEY